MNISFIGQVILVNFISLSNNLILKRKHAVNSFLSHNSFSIKVVYWDDATTTA